MKDLDLLDSGDWERYLMLHGSHERLPAFLEVLDAVGLGLMSHADYWRALRETWEMADVVHPDLSTWRALFRSARPDRGHLMDEAERAGLAALPARVTIHRGFAHSDGMRGLAWTLDRERAEFFASDFATSGRLAWLGVRPAEGAWVSTVTVARERVLAYLDGRGEDEVIVPGMRGYRPRFATAR
jgi:hypothetical protein